MKPFFLYIILFWLLLISQKAYAQEQKEIFIDSSGFILTDQDKYPGATVFLRDDQNQVKISHQGITMWSDKAVHYKAQDFIEAYGNVHIRQGDSIDLLAEYVEYSGKTKLAFASGNVVMTDPSSQLTTDTLYYDRVKQQAFYKSGGTVVRDSSGTITSVVGRYYAQFRKYQFINNVKLVNPDYTIDSERLDFHALNGYAFLFGPSTITTDESETYCEKGFYDTENKLGTAVKNSVIYYDNRIFEGDSMFFNNNTGFASATNHIKVTDTLNNSIVKGHYAEVFRDQDSVFITKRALGITVQENDSIYIHSDTLMVTGKPDHRITRAYYNAKIYKSDLSGKADSIHTDHKIGLTQLINLKRFSNQDAFASKRYPILWNIDNQITGDSIHLISNPKTEQLDSLKVFDNAFIIGKDTLYNGYNQISGQKLYGLFKDNEIYTIDIIKNAESIYYLIDENNELIGIDKSKSGNIKIWIEDNTITEVRKLISVDGSTYPESQFPKNARRLRGFVWREDERPKSIEDLFKDDPPLELPIIKGLDDYIPPEDFFDEELRERITTSNKDAKDKTTPNKAARRLPKPTKKEKKPTFKRATISKKQLKEKNN